MAVRYDNAVIPSALKFDGFLELGPRFFQT